MAARPGNGGTRLRRATVLLASGALGAALLLLSETAAAANQPPVACAGPDRVVQVNRPLTLDGSASYDPDGTVSQYYFNYGDGTWSGWQSSAVVEHTYTSLGTFTLKLWVKDNLGALSPYDTAVITVQEQPPDPPLTEGELEEWRQRLAQVEQSVFAGPEDGPQVEDDPCADNLPPAVSAGPDRQGQAGTPIVFSLAASDSDGTIVWYQVNFGDGQVQSGATLPPATHTYAAAGTYTVTLTARDDCGAQRSDQALATVSAASPPGLSAAFVVRTLEYVHPGTGAEQWHTYDLATEDIELGLRVVFDATPSTGAYYYCYSFGDGTYNADIYSPLAQHAYGAAGCYTVRLTVYDQSGLQMAEQVQQVYVAGLTLASTMPPPDVTFHPVLFALRGNQLWSICGYGYLGAADISNPYALPELTILPQAPFDVFCGMDLSASAAGQEKLYVARDTAGVEVFRANPATFARLSGLCLSAAQLGAASALDVAAVGDYLYVATLAPAKLLTYNMAGSSPQLVHTLPLPQGVVALARIADDALVVHNGQYALTVIDVRSPASPAVVQTRQTTLRLESNYRIRTCATGLAARAVGGTLLFDLFIPASPTEPIVVGAERSVPTCSSSFAITPGRLYVRRTTAIDKYDVADPAAAAYLMETVNTQDVSALTFFLHDPDGPAGGLKETLFAGINVDGFRSFVPTAPSR